MRPGTRLNGFLLLQNMRLQAFVSEGVVNRSLRAEDAALLTRVEAMNLREIARWNLDLSFLRNGLGCR